MRIVSPSPLRVFAPLILCVATLIGCLVVSLGHESGAGSASAATADGPVDGSGTGATCLITSSAGQYTSGMMLLRNTSDDPVEITAVRLDGAEGVKLAQSYLVPVRDGQALGNSSQWPPGKNLLRASRGWKDRRKALGEERLSPSDNGGTSNLVLHLAATGQGPARYASVTVDYRADGADLSTTNDVEVTVAPTC